MNPPKKVSIFIVNANYPFGKTETFLENEVKFISAYFEKVYLFPLNYPSKDFSVREVPDNVIYHDPLLDKSRFKRVLKFWLKYSPIGEYLRDLLALAKSGNGRYIQKLKSWSISLLVNRAFYKSEQFEFIKKNMGPDDILYFYWGGGRSRYGNDFDHGNTFIRVHGREIDLPRNHNYIILFEKSFNTKATFLAISDWVKNQILNLSTENKVIINRLGTFDRGTGLEDSSEQLIRIVSCSNVISLKRVHLIVEALYAIEDEKIEWVHFGDGVLFDQLKSYAQSLSSNIRCIFAGRVSNSEVLEFYKKNKIDLFINVSTTEGVPVSIMEAFSFGIPCFATDVGATSELLNNSNGVLVPKDFLIADLSECIKKSGTKEFKVKRSAARKTWETNCNAEKNYSELVEILQTRDISNK